MSSKPLDEVLERIDAKVDEGLLPIVVFDLDSTLFSTEPRNMRILGEFAQDCGDRYPGLREVVAGLQLSDMGWGIDEPMVSAGFDDSRGLAELKSFWFKRFFTDAYVVSDHPVAGASDYVSACHSRGALVYYLTGRHVGGMELGTVSSLVSHGFPYFRGRAILHLKPSFDMADKPFKEAAVSDIRSHAGEVVATFENEPQNANQFCEQFPAALHFLLDTVHSPAPDAPSEQLIILDDFVAD